MPRSEAIEAALRAIVDRAADSGKDSGGWPMSKVRTALIEQARVALDATEEQNRARCRACGLFVESDGRGHHMTCGE